MIKVNYTEKCHELAKARGGRFLSSEYITSQTKYEWECANNHRWMADHNHIRSGRWCSLCAPESRSIKQRVPIAKIIEYLSSIGVTLLSISYRNALTKYNFRCSLGHVWVSTFNTVQQGRVCTPCSRQRMAVLMREMKNPGNRIQKLCEEAAIKNNGQMLSPYVGWNDKILWRCALGHEWSAVHGPIVKRGVWCPFCVDNRKSQNEFFEFVKTIYPDAQSNTRGVLKNRRFELDVYIPSKNKAIEFDGENWHAKPEAIERDIRKNQECADAGVPLLRVPYRKWCSNREETEKYVLEFLNSD